MSKPWQRVGIVSALLGAPLALVACPGTDISGPTLDEGLACDESLRSESQLQLTTNEDVDILFVIDNSGSMGEIQVKLNDSLAALLERLDMVEANYRIAFTTTDNGNPWCPAGTTTPEAGNLVLSSCKDRLGNFVFNNGAVDVQDLACNQQCSLDAAALEILPTTTDFDDTPTPRPWVERIEQRQNLPPGTDVLEALRCFAPQGINGCGFESPLESMYLSLERAENSSEPAYGFLRANAILAVVLVSDEADCSYDKSWSEIFEQDGNKIFWSDPTASFPSSAVCWNAGVECIGDPSAYDGCEPADRSVDGVLGAAPGGAVLHPLSRYRGLLDGLEVQKQQLNADQELVFTLIAGVEGGGTDWSVSYAEAEDPQYQRDFGIGPGCTDTDGRDAVPPVRMRSLAEGVDPLGLYSVCADDYSAAMASLGDRIAAQIQPACFSQCAADTDLSTPQFEPSCTLEEDPPGNDNTTVLQQCVRDADGSYAIDPQTETYALPEGLDVCYVLLTDPDGSLSEDPNDDMSDICALDHYNVEFEIVRREGVPAAGGTSVSVSCELSACPELDCPGIGG